MRRGLTACAVLLLLGPVGCAETPANPAPIPSVQPYVQPSPPPLTSGQVVDETVAGQNVETYLPEGYSAGSAERYPLVVFFHSYQRDSHQMMKFTRFARLAPPGWILSSGDLGGEQHWGNEQAITLHQAMMVHLRSHYLVDPTRIYYVGFSMGAGTALLAALACKGTDDEPAAVASSQGWTNLAAMRTVHDGMYASSIDAAYGGSLTPDEQKRTDLVSRASEFAGFPLYLEHGDADQYIPPAQSQALHDQLDSLGIANDFSLFPGLGHDEHTIHEGAILDFFNGKRRAH